MSVVVLLGPQRLGPTIGQEVAAAGLSTGPLALITAGWQEREDEDQELRKVLPLEALNLRLYHRSEKLHRDDPEYFVLHRERQDRLRSLQRVYAQRLRALFDSVRRLATQTGPADLLDPERADAMEHVRALDRHHAARVAAELAAFEDAHRPGERDAIARQREEVAAEVGSCAGVLIAGGHIAVLMNRLELFGLSTVLPGRTVFAWSGGAMTLTDRVVLFHDSPPQGPGNAEILGAGLGLVPGLVVLPHARWRLHLEDATRVGCMAARFAPARCVPLDEGDRFTWDGSTLTGGPQSRWLDPDGDVLVGPRS